MSILVNDLVEAHKRGVKVKVILDRNIKFGKHGLVTEDYYVEEKNKCVFELLKNAGIEVYYDSKNITTHAKAIVVDGSITIVGSDNWTESALNKNNETAVVIRSPEVAAKFQEYFKTIGIDYEQSNKQMVKYVKVARSLIKGPLAKFVKTDNKGCWNLLMWLIMQNKPGEMLV